MKKKIIIPALCLLMATTAATAQRVTVYDRTGSLLLRLDGLPARSQLTAIVVLYVL